LETELAHARRQGFSLCQQLRHFFDPSSAKDASRCLATASSVSSITCKVNHTVKTHKPVGKVACRVLHSSCGNALSGMSAVADRFFGSTLKNVSFICKSTDEVQKRIVQTPISPSAVIGKLDIEDFFMTGDHTQIYENCTSHISDKKEKHFWSDFLSFMLFHQYVRDPIDGHFLRVICGTGMGSRHSGAVSNLNFYVIAERGFIDHPTTMELFGVILIAVSSTIFWLFAKILGATNALSQLLSFALQLATSLQKTLHLWLVRIFWILQF
jgi:hypothetical protein